MTPRLKIEVAYLQKFGPKKVFFTVWGNPVEKQLVWSWSALELKESTEKCEVRPATKLFLIGRVSSNHMALLF